MELKFTVQTRIQRPVREVFDAVHDPQKLQRYFATGGASGPLEEGKVVQWRWHDFPEAVADVTVRKVEKDKLIVLEWESGEGGYNTRVEMNFEALGPSETLVKISESGWKATDKGLSSSYSNCEGWTQAACSLKAFVEHGINLREGFYAAVRSA